MNVRGERVLIFGDSLSHHGHDAGPEIWDVDQGSARASGQPGDLLASMLLEQGATAARVNARVGRSAHNFFGRENHQALFASDQAFLPTKVLIILGTNDIGLNMAVDKVSMTRIRDFYKGLGAEVWGVGPFAYANDRYTNGAPAVVEMMKEVFGSKYIDPRPITAMVGRGSDGVHFGAEAARQTALGLQQLVLASSSGKGTWMMLGLGVLAAIGGSIAYSWWKTGKAPALLSGPGLGESCNPNMTPEAFKRCVKRQKRAQLGIAREEDPLAKRQRISREITELIKDPDPSVMEVAQDLALQHEIKLSELSKGGTDDRGTFWLNDNPDVIERDRVSWRIKRVNERHGGECKAIFDVRIDGKRVGGEERESGHIKFEEHYQGNKDYCRRAATAQAWALAKETKKLRARGFVPQAHDIFHALDRDNSEPEELFGLRGDREDRNEHPTETFKMLTQTARTPAELVAAKDYALEHGIKIGKLRTLYLSPVGAPDDPATRVNWSIMLLHKSEGPWDNQGQNTYEVTWDTLLDGKPLHIGPGFPRRARSLRELEQIVGAEAWEVANELKLYRGKGLVESMYRMRVVDALYSEAARDHLKEQPDLFGLGARQPIKHGGDPSAARFQERMNPDWAYIDGDEEFKDKRREFRRLIDDEGPEVLDIAEDFAEENDIPISQLTTLNHDHADAGVVKIYPAKGAYDAYQVWWDVHEDPKNPGQWEPELNLGWGTHRETIGSVPHIRNGEWTKPVIPFGTADTVEHARRTAAFQAWHVSKLLRELPRSASIDDAKALLKEFERSHPQSKRFEAAHRLYNKSNLFGSDQSSAIRSRGMGSPEQDYRVAYALVTRRDGKIVTVRKIVEASRALTLPEAEAWRRKWHRGGNTAWVETMDGQHVPVKGAKRPGRFVDDARPNDVHATLTADYARPR